MDLVDRHPLKEKRRANKPLLERKRRARINDSLTDLKHLVLSSLNKDAAKYAKMEKVDILDMTVQFLKGQNVEQRKDDYASIFRAGYSECTKEIYQNIMTMEGIDHTMKCRILTNIASNLPDNKNTSPPPSPTLSNNCRSPIPSPTSTPIKQCMSAIFDPTTSRHLIVPMVTPTSSVTMTSLSNNCYMKYPPAHLTKNVIRQTTDQLPKRHYIETKSQRHCMDQRLYCSDANPTIPTKSSEVWRPW